MNDKMALEEKLKISAYRDYAKLRRNNGGDDTWLRLKKEILHMKKHLIWVEEIIDQKIQETEPDNIKTPSGYMTANPLKKII